MNNKHPDIPMILSHAPKPPAPADLKDSLLADASKALRRSANQSRIPYTNQSWLRRWWPALAPATVSLACAVVITFQQGEVSDLKQRLEILSAANAPAVTVPIPQRVHASSDAAAKPNVDEELQQLRARSTQLAADINQLEELVRENEQLRSQIAAASANRFSPEELRAIDDAKRRAERIACVNNLKQLGLGIRMWSLDHKDAFPTNLMDTVSYAGTPKIFICPADTNRPAAQDFRSFTSANCSYDYYVGNLTDLEQVITRCPIHSAVGLSDGSVQQITPDRLVEKDGKYYIGPRQ